MHRPGLTSLEIVVDSLFLDPHHDNPAHDPFSISFVTKGLVDLNRHLAFGRHLADSQQVLTTDMDGFIEWDYRRDWTLNATYHVSDSDRLFKGIATKGFSVPTKGFNVISFAVTPGGFDLELFRRHEDTVQPVSTSEIGYPIMDALAWHAGRIISSHLECHVTARHPDLSRAPK